MMGGVMSEETHGEYEDDDLRAEAEEATKDIDVFESGHSNEGEAEEFASKIIKRAASLKAVKINRERFCGRNSKNTALILI